MTWRIAAWSRAEARGEIESALGRLPFDASVADVDDFDVGEAVEVRLAPAGDSWRVLRLWPDVPRFRPPERSAAGPPLDADLAKGVDAFLAALPQGDHRFEPSTTEALVRLTVLDRGDAYATPSELRGEAAAYAELPLEDGIDVRFVRRTTDAERAYLATRTTLDATMITIAFVDHDRRFYFLACRRLVHEDARVP